MQPTIARNEIKIVKNGSVNIINSLIYSDIFLA